MKKVFEIKKEEGIAEGENKERYRIAKNLIGVCSDEQLAEATGLSLAEAEQLVKSCTV